MQEAILAKEKAHGRLVYGRPLIVHLASEKYLADGEENSAKAVEAKKYGVTTSSCSGEMSRSAKIAAIRNKLKAMDEEPPESKKQKLANSVPCRNSLDPSSIKKKTN